MSELNIFQRMSAITNEISRVAKNLSVDQGKSSYKAVGEADVLAAVKPAEEKYGVYSYPAKREIVESAILTTVSSQGYERKQQFIRIRTVYRFVNIDNPYERVTIVTYGDGVDTQDKAPGKAMTYGDKYALLKAYKIITGDDPDQKGSEELSGKEKKQTQTPMASDKQIAYIRKLYEASPENADYIDKVCPAPDKLTMAQATQIIGALKK